MMSKKQTGHFLIFCSILMFGANIPICKYLMSDPEGSHISGIALTGVRICFGCIAFWISSLFVPSQKITWKDHRILLTGGIMGILLNQGLFIVGLSKTAPIAASIIITSTPMFSLVIAVILMQEIITLQKIGGVIVGMVGAILLIYFSNYSSNGNKSNIEGNLMVVGSAISYAFYLVITKPLAEKYNAITLMKWMFTYAAILFTPWIFNDINNSPIFHETSPKALIMLAYPLFIASFLAYLLIPMAQKRIRSTTISMYNNLQPVVASTIAILLNQDQLNWQKGVAVILVFGGVYLVTNSKSKKIELTKI